KRIASLPELHYGTLLVMAAPLGSTIIRPCCLWGPVKLTVSGAPASGYWDGWFGQDPPHDGKDVSRPPVRTSRKKATQTWAVVVMLSLMEEVLSRIVCTGVWILFSPSTLTFSVYTVIVLPWISTPFPQAT